MKADPQEMNNLATDPASAERLEAMKARFWEAREFYGDTDDAVWTGWVKKFRPEDYIRQPKK